MLVRSGYSELLTAEHQELVIDVGEEYIPEISLWQNIVDMEFDPESIQQISGLNTAVAMAEGARFTTDDPILGGSKEFEGSGFGLAISVSRRFMDTEQFGLVEEMIAELPRAALDQINVQGTSPLVNAFNTSFVGFTAGEALCQSHSLLDGTAIDNSTTADLGVVALQEMTKHFRRMRNERNRRTPMNPDWVVHPTDLTWEAREALASALDPLTGNNAVNAIVADGIMRLPLTYLDDDTNNWFGLAAKGAHRMYLRFAPGGRPEFTSWMDEATRTFYAAVHFCLDSGFTSWRGVYGSNVT